MNDPQSGDPGDLIGLEEASALLEVPIEQVRTMVDEDLLVPVDADAPDLRFPRGEVIAARQVGG
jgi:hypothetical protein